MTLPKGWKKVTLGEVAEVKIGNSAPQDKKLFKNGVYPFVRTSDVGEIHFGRLFSAKDKLTEAGIKGLRLMPSGSVLVPKSGASTFLNHRVLLEVPAYMASHLAAIIADIKFITSQYLWWFLARVRAQDLLPEDINYPSLNQKQIENIEILLPSLPEQKRIVERIDEVFGLISKKKKLKQQAENLKELWQSELEKAFTLPNSETVKLGEVCNVIAGNSPPSSSFNERGEGLPFHQGKKHFGTRFLQESNVWTGRVTRQAEVGDIVMSVRAPVGPINEVQHTTCIGRGLAAISSKSNIVKDFLWYSLYEKEKELENYGAGCVFPSISKKQIENIEIPLPPLPEQKKIAAHLEAFWAEIQSAEALTQSQLKNLEELRQSILEKAFSGRLFEKEEA